MQSSAAEGVRRDRSPYLLILFLPEATFSSSANLKGQDLISLAEKGKVGGGSCPSSSCSTTSGEDEPHKEKALRHRDSRGSGGNHSRKLAIQVSVDTMNEEMASYSHSNREIAAADPNAIEQANGNTEVGLSARMEKRIGALYIFLYK